MSEPPLGQGVLEELRALKASVLAAQEACERGAREVRELMTKGKDETHDQRKRPPET